MQFESSSTREIEVYRDLVWQFIQAIIWLKQKGGRYEWYMERGLLVEYQVKNLFMKDLKTKSIYFVREYLTEFGFLSVHDHIVTHKINLLKTFTCSTNFICSVILSRFAMVELTKLKHH